MVESKKVSESKTTLTEIVLPDHANPLGYLRGGKLVDWMDIAAEVAAQRHAGLPAVTVSLDRMTFSKPILVKLKNPPSLTVVMFFGLCLYL